MSLQLEIPYQLLSVSGESPADPLDPCDHFAESWCTIGLIKSENLLTVASSEAKINAFETPGDAKEAKATSDEKPIAPIDTKADALASFHSNLKLLKQQLRACQFVSEARKPTGYGSDNSVYDTNNTLKALDKVFNHICNTIKSLGTNTEELGKEDMTTAEIFDVFESLMEMRDTMRKRRSEINAHHWLTLLDPTVNVIVSRMA